MTFPPPDSDAPAGAPVLDAGAPEDAGGPAAPEAQVAAEVPWRVSDGLIGWGVGFVAGVVAAALLSVAFGRRTGDGGVVLPMFAIAVSQLVQWTGSLAWCRHASVLRGTGRLLRDVGLEFVTWKDAALGVGAGFLGQLFLANALPRMYELLGRDTEQLGDDVQQLSDAAGGLVEFALLGVFVVVGAPIVEEVVFRGLLQGALLRRLRPVAAVALSSLLFGLAHWQNLETPGLIAIGAVFGTLAYRTKRLGASVVCHMTFNLLAVIGLAVQRAS